jgi:acyl carrier protein
MDLPFADRGVDSMGVVMLIAELERELGVRFPAGMMNRQTFGTVRTVVEALRGLLDPAAAA